MISDAIKCLEQYKAAANLEAEERSGNTVDKCSYLLLLLSPILYIG